MRTEYVTAWMARPKARRWTRYLVPAWLHAMSPKPPLDVLGAGAVRSLCTHDDRTHAKMLALIDTPARDGRPRAAGGDPRARRRRRPRRHRSAPP